MQDCSVIVSNSVKQISFLQGKINDLRLHVYTREMKIQFFLGRKSDRCAGWLPSHWQLLIAAWTQEQTKPTNSVQDSQAHLQSYRQRSFRDVCLLSSIMGHDGTRLVLLKAPKIKNHNKKKKFNSNASF